MIEVRIGPSGVPHARVRGGESGMERGALPRNGGAGVSSSRGRACCPVLTESYGGVELLRGVVRLVMKEFRSFHFLMVSSDGRQHRFPFLKHLPVCPASGAFNTGLEFELVEMCRRP